MQISLLQKKSIYILYKILRFKNISKETINHHLETNKEDKIYIDEFLKTIDLSQNSISNLEQQIKKLEEENEITDFELSIIKTFTKFKYPENKIKSLVLRDIETIRRIKQNEIINKNEKLIENK